MVFQLLLMKKQLIIRDINQERPLRCSTLESLDALDSKASTFCRERQSEIFEQLIFVMIISFLIEQEGN